MGLSTKIDRLNHFEVQAIRVPDFPVHSGVESSAGDRVVSSGARVPRLTGEYITLSWNGTYFIHDSLAWAVTL